jgi:hypothetical protein
MRYARGMALNDRDLKFFRPLWLRVALTAGLAVWCGLEAVLSHDQLWIGVTGFGVAYCLYNFFWKWPKSLPDSALPSAAGAAEVSAPTPETPPAGDPAKQP